MRLPMNAPAATRPLAPTLATSLAANLDLLACLALAAAVRGFHVLRAPFPLNDGGLFYAMARDIQANHFLLPATTSYNGDEIPFSYSPLGLYLAAVVDLLTPASMLDVVAVLPLIGSVLSVWAFWRLACLLLPGRTAALLATAAFALAPRAFVWLVMGGGLTRSFGLAFALLAVAEIVRATERDGGRRAVANAGILLGLTALTHLETAVFAAATVMVFACFRPRARAMPVGVAAMIGLAMTLPWVLAVVGQHGPEPFLNATDHGGRMLDEWSFSWRWLEGMVRGGPVYTSEAYFPLIGTLAVFGLLYSLATRRGFLPAWLIVISFLELRGGYTFVMAPTALLAGFMAAEFMDGIRAVKPPRVSTPSWPVLAVAGACSLYMVVSALQTKEDEGRFLVTLPAADRDAMEWARGELPADADVLVLPIRAWYGDYAGEWFPALAERRSVATPQGYEWTGQEFARRDQLHGALRECTTRGVECVTEFAKANGADYIYVPSQWHQEIATGLRVNGEWEVVYDRGALIVQAAGPAAAAIATK